jgi:hypothetical protein
MFLGNKWNLSAKGVAAAAKVATLGSKTSHQERE